MYSSINDFSVMKSNNTKPCIGKKYNSHCTVLERHMRVQEVETPRISRQSAHDGAKVHNPIHRPSLPPGKIPSTHFC